MNQSKTKKYTEDFKISSAKLAVESEQSISASARNLGINISTLHTWIRKYHPTQTPTQVGADPLQEELKRLKKEVAQLKMERDILKKAAAYFAQDAV